MLQVDESRALDYISLKKLTNELDLSRPRVYQLVHEGRLTPKYIGKKIFFKIQEVNELPKPKEIA